MKAMLGYVLGVCLMLMLPVANCVDSGEDENDNDNKAVGSTLKKDSDPGKMAKAYQSANAYRGGLLYDKYWKVDRVKSAETPTETHALYSADGKTSGADTWRCKECHGWDYKGKDGAYGTGSHFSGIKGILATQKSVAQLKKLIKDDHKYGDVFSDADVMDVVKFILEGLIDTDYYIAGDKTAKGTAQAGQKLFEKTCMPCHGAAGRDLNFKSATWYKTEFIPEIATDNPWEFMHKVRFGHPGSSGQILKDGRESPAMPNEKEHKFALDEVTNILAYAQTLRSSIDDANLLRGGRLYDKYWKVSGVLEKHEPIYSHGLYPAEGSQSGGTTWRCKECHGWDYKGKDGAYASDSHFTNIKGILNIDKSDQEIFELLKNPKSEAIPNGHGYQRVLADTDIWSLVLFTTWGIMPTDDYVDADKKAKSADVSLGMAKFEAICQKCHGADGKDLNFGSDAEPEYVGDLATDNPWEFMHKVRFGHPGSKGKTLKDGKESDSMPDAGDNNFSFIDVVNILAYCQSLAD